MTIQARIIAPLSTIALLATLVSVLLCPARAGANAPDMPSWTIQPYGEDAKKSSDDEGSNGSDVSAAVERARSSVSKAEEMVEAGRTTEAQAAIQAALLSLDALPNSRPDVKALREKLSDLKDRCEKAAEKAEKAEKEKAESKDDDAKTPEKLRPVKAERNNRVDKWIDFFTGRGREQFQRWLDRSGSYMDLLTHNLRAEGVPEELANLVFVESGFNMHAKSVARAVGPWQFIRGTAKLFGLQMTPYVDQRRDPELATRAAARYLRRLYNMFDGSWPLAIAAYNSGEGTVQRAIRRQGTQDFWALNLPRETEEYVPQFLAVMEISSDPERYGFDLPSNSPFRYDEVTIRGPVDLKLVSGITAIPFEELKQLNPMFVRHRSPAGPQGTAIRVPQGKGDEVQELLQTCYKPKPLTKAELREAQRAQRKELRYASRKHHRGKRHTHVVRRGETLSEIGARYGKAPRTLARLNRIAESGHIRAGQRIRIQ